eukprot:PhF_6_TR3469/c0_g3_i2/m.5079
MASKTDFSKKHRREANEGVYVCTVMVSADGSELQEECVCSFKMKKPSDCYSHAQVQAKFLVNGCFLSKKWYTLTCAIGLVLIRYKLRSLFVAESATPKGLETTEIT